MSLPLSESNFVESEETDTAKAMSNWPVARATNHGIRVARKGRKNPHDGCEDRWNRDEWFKAEMVLEKHTLETMQYGHLDD